VWEAEEVVDVLMDFFWELCADGVSCRCVCVSFCIVCMVFIDIESGDKDGGLALHGANMFALPGVLAFTGRLQAFGRFGHSRYHFDWGRVIVGVNV